MKEGGYIGMMGFFFEKRGAWFLRDDENGFSVVKKQIKNYFCGYMLDVERECING